MMTPSPAPLLEVRGLSKTYTQGRWWERRSEVRALDRSDLSLDAGKTLALVGESGSGKSTLAMCVVGLEKADEGEIWFDGKNLSALRKSNRFQRCPEIQLVLQDATGALNPRMDVLELIEEPLLIQKTTDRKSRRQRVLQAMDQVGLPGGWQHRQPHQLSGGQRQRVAIARALVLTPKLLILDEALAGLDLSIQGQISNLLLDLQAANNLSYLYISHDLTQVAQFADDVIILDRGRVLKSGTASEIFTVIEQSPTPIPLGEKSRAMSATGASA